MSKIFLDTNVYIDLVEGRKTAMVSVDSLEGYPLYISPLSTHILCYSYKYKIPYQKLSRVQELFEVVDFTGKILQDALTHPTNDLEDNIQLHSAAKAECDYFLTNDKNLLRIKYFGKTKISNTIKS